MGGKNIEPPAYSPIDKPPRPDMELERYKALLQAWVEQYKYQCSQDLEMFRAVSQMGQNAIRMLFLMNAGAAGALLTFIGHLSISTPARVPILADSLTIFVVGMLLAGLDAGVTYLSQWLYHQKPDGASGGWLNALAVAIGTASLSVFGWGIYSTYHALSRFS